MTESFAQKVYSAVKRIPRGESPAIQTSPFSRVIRARSRRYEVVPVFWTGR